MTDRYGHPRQTIFGRRHASAAASVSYSTSQHPQPAQHAPLPPTSSSATAHGLGMAASAAATATSQHPVARRNLFQGQLTRRPPPGKGGVVVGGGGGGGGLGLDGVDDGDGDTVVVDEEGDDDDGGIVVRGARGEVELDEPPCLAVDDPEEVVLDMRQENEKERQKLADAVKQHQSRQHSVPAQPEELFEAVKASLRAKVAALAEDNWMYEKEEEPRLV